MDSTSVGTIDAIVEGSVEGTSDRKGSLSISVGTFVGTIDSTVEGIVEGTSDRKGSLGRIVVICNHRRLFPHTLPLLNK